MAVDETKLNEMIGKVITDIGATFHAPLVLIGEKLGLFKQLASGKMDADELAAGTGTAKRYVQEWLPAMASGGYVMYDAEIKKYYLTEEQTMVLADEESPAYMPGAFQAATAAIKSEPKITEAFQTGEGVGWHEHDSELFHGTERFYKPLYRTNLVQNWIPALNGVKQKLEAGAMVADVGCGYGLSTILMAQAFPQSYFEGFDYHGPSIEAARERALQAGVSDRVKFEAVAAQDLPASEYDLVTCFDCLHDMGDPAGAAETVFKSLKPDGTWMIVEPYAGDTIEQNFNPIGRLYYCASVLLCVSGSLAQDVGLALGAQAGETRLKEVVLSGGFTRFRRAAESPINIVYEARP
jgi:2-polyprenyl-3-methyl-5-hydroxy-6-metoxy-1,4-benzoquinol methylase